MARMNRYIPANCGTGTGWGGSAGGGTNMPGTAFAGGNPFVTYPAPAMSWLPLVVVGGLLLMGMGILKEPRL